MTESLDPNAENSADDSKGRPRLSDEDEQLLSYWWQALLAQDERLKDKKLILKLAARSMYDSEFRGRLVTDTERMLPELLPSDADLPAGVTLNFLVNTEDIVNIVLPRSVDEVAEEHRPALRELLKSRTAESSSFFQDDFRNHGDLWDWGPFATPIDQGMSRRIRLSYCPSDVDGSSVMRTRCRSPARRTTSYIGTGTDPSSCTADYLRIVRERAESGVSARGLHHTSARCPSGVRGNCETNVRAT